MASKRSSNFKKKIYRHSSTFYRKVKLQLSNNDDNNIECNLVVIKPKSNKPLINGRKSDCLKPEQNKLNKSVSDTTDDINDLNEDDLYDTEDKNCVSSQITFSEQLTQWCLQHRITHCAINDLLNLLNTNHIKVPNDCRTLLKTPKIININPMGNGEFWYNGIRNYLLSAFSTIDQDLSVSLVFNVDGLPPFHSSPVEFWPILFRIEDMPQLQPMVIAIYCGETKPPLQEFLSNFVEELNDILNNGVLSNGHQIKVSIKYFVCDTPARNFIKGTVGFNAAHGCIKCTTIGEYDKGGRHMSFPNINSPLRSDENFRLKLDEDHHKETTPLIKLPIDTIEDVIIADSLHLIDLGVMRKCLYGWVNGSYNFRTKWSAHQINLLSDMLEDCNKTRPAEIHRAVRRLKCLKFWKGVEYRTFVLYVGPVVLKDFLSKEAYHNFVTLSCAITILSCKSYLVYTNVAKQLLEDYVNQFISIYGIDAVSSNVHNLCHITNDVIKFGSLSEISAYPFENFLGLLKSLIRTGNRPLAQIAKRVIELSKFSSYAKTSSVSSFVKNEDRFQKHPAPFCSKVFKSTNYY